MKAIALDKLRTLAAAVANAAQGSKAWDAATDALSDKFSPRCLVTLIDQLGAAQREHEAEIKNHRDHAVRLINERDQFRQRAEAAEAELKHRDDAVSVAIMLVEKVSTSMTRHTVGFTHAGYSLPAGEYQLYLTAPAATLPPEMSETDAVEFVVANGPYSKSEAAQMAWNACREVAKEPGVAMSKISLTKLRDISQSAKEVLDAIAGDHEYVNPNDSSKMCQLWDYLNDRHAPPEVVKSMADELINLRETNQRLRQQRIDDRRRFSNPAPIGVVTLIKPQVGSDE